METYVTKPAEVDRKWYVVDAENKVLGRLAAEVAAILRGKKKTIFQPNVDTGDYVIVINAEKAILTGLKDEQKTYFVQSRYVGHSRHIAYRKLKEEQPGKIVGKAIKGMLPHNALGRKMVKKLFVYVGKEHKHQAQKPEPLHI